TNGCGKSKSRAGLRLCSWVTDGLQRAAPNGGCATIKQPPSGRLRAEPFAETSTSLPHERVAVTSRVGAQLRDGQARGRADFAGMADEPRFERGARRLGVELQG